MWYSSGGWQDHSKSGMFMLIVVGLSSLSPTMTKNANFLVSLLEIGAACRQPFLNVSYLVPSLCSSPVGASTLQFVTTHNIRQFSTRPISALELIYVILVQYTM
jgi:hypothetical protein